MDIKLAMLMLAVGFTSSLVAQEQETFQESSAIVVASSADGDGPLGATIMTVDSSELGDGPMVFTDFAMEPSFIGGAGGSAFSMLNNASVQKDLQLVDDQLSQIEEINREFSTKIREKVEEMRDENGAFRLDNAANWGDLIKNLQEEQQQQIKNVLLPNQQERLKQVERQMKMKRMGSERALTKVLAEELGLTPEQKKNIKEKSAELQADLEAQIKALKAKAKKELLAELSSDQRDKLETLLGDEFIVKDEDFGNRFRGIRNMMNRPKSKAKDF